MLNPFFRMKLKTTFEGLGNCLFCSIQAWAKSVKGLQYTQSQCCGSGMLIPDPKFFPSRILIFPSGFQIRIKEFKYFNPKIVYKLSVILFGLFIQDADPGFLSFPDSRSRIHGSKRHMISDPGSRSQHCLEYQSVCPIVEIESPPPASKCVSPLDPK